MAEKMHDYAVDVVWTGNRGRGTSSHSAYSRDHEISAGEKPVILGSSDPGFRGDPARWNPEDLLVASLSACHKLWYLGLCASAGISVERYEDRATGRMVERADGAGQFTDVTLHPVVTIRAGDDIEKAKHLHHVAHEKCFIANSVNFPIQCNPDIRVAAP